MGFVASEREAFQTSQNASREALAKLDRYAELLVEWNQRFNLVSASTLPHIWLRHFLDSAQLVPYIKAGARVADIGSGAGFPGLVLSIMGVENLHLVESIGKKANFLQAVIDDLKLNSHVRTERVEMLKGEKYDIITARALKPLPALLPLVFGVLKKSSKLLLLKGENVDAELTESAKHWKFEARKIPSLTNPAGCLLVLRDIEIRHDAPRQLRARFLKRK